MLKLLRYHWLASDGRLVWLRYRLGRLHERLFGYDPECECIAHHTARWLKLSGY